MTNPTEAIEPMQPDPDKESRLGLEMHEVDWLRENMGIDPTATALVRQYQMVVRVPRDQAARGIFAAMLDDWRNSRGDLA